MKIGIFDADGLPVEVVKEHGTYSDMFVRLLSSVDASIQFKSYCVTRLEYPGSIDECNAYIVTGSKYGAYEDLEWIHRLKEFINELYKNNIKMAGICFGHQVIAQALGGLTEKSSKGWGIGMMTSEISSEFEQPWLNPGVDRYVLYVSHQDQVVKLPPRAQLVASNTFCPISSFIIKDKVLTFQGHPEFNADYLKYIINNRKKDIGEEKSQRALLTLDNKTDSLLVARWLVQFLTGRSC